MNARQKRRTRRAVVATSEQQMLMRIHTELSRMQTPVDPDILSDINTKLERIDTSLSDIRADAVRRGTNAGAIAGAITGGLAGGIVTLGIMIIKAKLDL